MINLTYRDGLMVPMWESVTPISFKEAYSAIQDMQLSLITEAVDGKQSNGKLVTFVRNIMEKIMGFFRKLISHIFGLWKARSAQVAALRGNILQFNDQNYTVKAYKNIMNPRVKSMAAYRAIAKFIDKESAPLLSDNIDLTKTRFTNDALMSDILGTHLELYTAETVTEYVYGDMVEIRVVDYTPKQWIGAFNLLDEDIPLIKEAQEEASALMSKVIAAINRRDGNHEIQGAVGNFASVVMKACYIMANTYTHGYNQIFSILKHMGHSR